MRKKLLSVLLSVGLIAGIGIITLTFSTLAWISKDHYVMFGTLGSLVVIFSVLWKQQYLRNHPEAKSK